MWLEVQKPRVNTDDGTQASISIHITMAFGVGHDLMGWTRAVTETGACLHCIALHYLHYMNFTTTNNNNDNITE